MNKNRACPARKRGMPARRVGLAIVFLLVCGPTTAARAHGVVHALIESLSTRIGQEPRNPELYLNRGELYRLDQDWEAALADYDRAARLDPGLEAVDLCRGVLFYEAGRFAAAVPLLDRILERDPGHLRARVTLARVLRELGRSRDAAAEFAVVLDRDRRAEIALERAQALAGGGPALLGEARRALDEGVRLLGPVTMLQQFGIELDLRAGAWQSALSRLDTLQRLTTVKAPWLERRGEILEGARRFDEALEVYRAAHADLEALPSHRRATPALRTLADRVRAAIVRLTGGPSAGS